MCKCHFANLPYLAVESASNHEVLGLVSVGARTAHQLFPHPRMAIPDGGAPKRVEPGNASASAQPLTASAGNSWKGEMEDWTKGEYGALGWAGLRQLTRALGLLERMSGVCHEWWGLVGGCLGTWGAPPVALETCSLLRSTKYLTTYYVRYVEGRAEPAGFGGPGESNGGP
jgi:hypothetical protein